MKYFLFLFCLTTSLVAQEYFVCLDGGGSKTSLQILDKTGNPLVLERNGEKATTLLGPASNINIVGEQGFQKVLDQFFDELLVEDVSFTLLQKQCRLIGGFAGLASPVNLQKAQALFEKKGFSSDQLFLTNDAKLALKLLDGNGIVLISGTGSVAFGIDGNTELRAGGFGRVLGDEGSGYLIGLRALKASLEQEYGYGQATSITAKAKELYQVGYLRDLIPKVNNGELTPAEVAKLAPFVFALAEEGDGISQEIIQSAVDELAGLVLHVMNRMQAKEIPVILIGGLFKGYPYFAEKIFQSEALQSYLLESGKSYSLIDLNNENIATKVAKKIIQTTE